MCPQSFVDTVCVPDEQDTGDGGDELPDYVGCDIDAVSGVLQYFYSET